MSKKIQSWLTFAVRVRNHIRDYVIKQYGEEGQDPATEYTAEDCVKQAQRYLARFGKQSRRGEELLDLYKAAHWIQIAHDKLSRWELPAEEVEEVERNFANEPKTITHLRADKTGRGSDWTPRDALIDALRDIDSGEHAPTQCLVIFGNVHDNGAVSTRFYNRTDNRYMHMGLIEEHKRRLTVKDVTGNY